MSPARSDQPIPDEHTRDRAGRLAGKRLLVTGAASGIGRATALRMAAESGDIALLDLQAGDDAAAECEALGVRARFWACDVSSEPAVAAAVEQATRWLGGLDAVVHVAGIVGLQDVQVDALGQDDWDPVMAVNVTGAFLVSKHTTPHLERTSGVLVLTGSGAGIWVGHRSVAYGASKGGLHGLALTLEGPLRARGIRVNDVAPGAVDTPLVRSLSGDARVDENRRKRLIIAAEKVASLMAFLASDDASAVRGTVRTW